MQELLRLLKRHLQVLLPTWQLPVLLTSQQLLMILKKQVCGCSVLLQTELPIFGRLILQALQRLLSALRVTA